MFKKIQEVSGVVYLLQQLLIDAARKFPHKEAVIFRDETISYQALDSLSSKLATVLQKNGVGRGDRVGIYINKSIPSIITIQAILKAGGVYVPLDPNAPVARLAYIIRDCGIRCLVTSTKKAALLTDMFPQDNPLAVVVLTDNLDSPSAILSVKTVPWLDVLDCETNSSSGNLCIETDLAYILYTSGSTGVPKGVMISHINALTFINWAQDAFQINADDRLSSHAPLHFDLSIFDIFVALKAGSTVVLVPEGTSTFPIRLADWIEENRISVWYSVPSLLSMMLVRGRLERHKFPNLRTILFAGEVFPAKYLRELMTQIPRAEYYNLYGPTETNVITYYHVPPLPADQVKPIPIGKACANMEVFILDGEGNIVTDPGQEGELYGRGSCVAQGYWGDREKTKKSFIPNPLQPHFQETIYRSGDIAMLDEDGNYIFIGRRDHMVKSRGYRIELGEIEAVLYSNPTVKEAAVVAIPDDLIGNRLMAYIVLIDSATADASALQRFCSARIPKYMIPEAIEYRESLPKTSTGKIDRQGLVE